ncbi:MAG: thioesterase domain-containing protein [Cyanobacteria bacterium J06639_14]
MWIHCPNPRPHADLRVFCIPYAGGSVSIYQPWTKLPLTEVEICLIELPGRGTRLTELPFTSLNRLIPSLGEAMLPWLDKPFTCFGHSLGGLIAFELARWLRQYQKPEPQHLWISGARAPHLTLAEPPIHALPRADFIAELRRYNGTPAAVLENTELMDLLLPTLRADFMIRETYCYQQQVPLSCAITALWGEQDTIVSREEIVPWQIHTTNSFSLKAVPGDHFFVHQIQISQYLKSFLCGPV